MYEAMQHADPACTCVISSYNQVALKVILIMKTKARMDKILVFQDITKKFHDYFFK